MPHKRPIPLLLCCNLPWCLAPFNSIFRHNFPERVCKQKWRLIGFCYIATMHRTQCQRENDLWIKYLINHTVRTSPSDSSNIKMGVAYLFYASAMTCTLTKPNIMPVFSCVHHIRNASSYTEIWRKKNNNNNNMHVIISVFYSAGEWEPESGLSWIMDGFCEQTCGQLSWKMPKAKKTTGAENLYNHILLNVKHITNSSTWDSAEIVARRGIFIHPECTEQFL